MSAVAIVGSGPTGCFLAQALKKARPDLDVTILEKRATPYGLVRAGVAPDHVGTKSVTRQFDRLFERDGVRLVTGIEVGRTLSLEALRALFPAVVLAIGLEADRRLAIPGETLPGVTGSGAFARFANGEAGVPAPVLGPHLVVIGAGNVAIDVARVSLKGAGAFGGATPVERVSVIARGPREAARFDAAMLRELEQAAGGAVAFRFDTRPIAIEGAERVAAIMVEGPAGIERIPCDAVVTAIGYRRCSAAAIDLDPPARGAPVRLDDGLFAAGWFRRGPRGTIAEARTEAQTVAAAILADPCLTAVQPGYDGLAALIGAKA